MFSRVPMTLRDTFWLDPYFSTNWTDYDLLRDEMLQHSLGLRRHFDHLFIPIELTGSRPEALKQKVNKKDTELKQKDDKPKEVKPSSTEMMEVDDFHRLMPFPRMRQFLRMFSDQQDSSLTDLWGRMDDDHTIKLINNDKTFELSLDTHNYKPDEIKVTVNNNNGVIKVEAKHEEQSDDGNKFVSKQFFRQYALPKGCKPENVISNLSADGVLMITAPKEPDQAIKAEERQVPIEMKNGVEKE